MKTFKQQGLSSVEMVLVMPFILLFFLMIANVGQFWHIKLDNLINARTEAWREAMFDSLPNSPLCETIEDVADGLRDAGDLSFAFSSDTTRHAFNEGLSPGGKSLACKGNVNKDNQEYRGTTVINVAASGTGLHSDARKYRDGFIGELNKTEAPPYATTGRAYYIWGNWLFDGLGVVLLEDYHVIDVNGTWQRQDIPMGHDDYIDRFLIKP